MTQTNIIDDDCSYDTHPAYVEASIKRSIGQYARYCNYIYVGRTNNPKLRFSQHQRNLAPGDKAWDEMRIVYRTDSLGFAVQLENSLLAYIHQAHLTNIRWNEKGTQWEGPQDYVVYLLENAGGRSKGVSRAVELIDPYQDNDYCSGHYDYVIEQKLKKLLDRKAAGKKRIYVGVTNDPLRRYKEHQWKTNNSWERISILYKTSSLNYAARAETMLIAYAKSKYPALNVGSGLMPNSEDTHFYVYFLLDRAL